MEMKSAMPSDLGYHVKSASSGVTMGSINYGKGDRAHINGFTEIFDSTKLLASFPSQQLHIYLICIFGPRHVLVVIYCGFKVLYIFFQHHQRLLHIAAESVAIIYRPLHPESDCRNVVQYRPMLQYILTDVRTHMCGVLCKPYQHAAWEWPIVLFFQVVNFAHCVHSRDEQSEHRVKSYENLSG